MYVYTHQHKLALIILIYYKYNEIINVILTYLNDRIKKRFLNSSKIL